MSAGAPRYEDLIGLWQHGERRLRELEPGERQTAQRVVDAILDELRRRLGGAFSVQELADLATREGTDWASTSPSAAERPSGAPGRRSTPSRSAAKPTR